MVDDKKIAETFSRHKRAVLMASGGKDSMACIYLLEKYLPQIIVLWVNTGAGFPEIKKIMADVKAAVPNFIEVTTDQAKQVEQWGYPTETLPVNYTVTGQILSGKKPVKMQSYVACCNTNIWQPAMDAARRTEATLLIRGQRNDELLKGPFRTGDTADGFELLYPIQDWKREDVLKYLKERGFKIPPHYSLAATSLDCWSCTAYCYEHKDKLAYMKKNHPDWHDEYLERLHDIRGALARETGPLDNLLADDTTNLINRGN